MTAQSVVLPLHPSDKPKKANTKEHTYKNTKCPSIRATTALGYTFFRQTHIHKYKRKDKNAQKRNDKMSFPAWYERPWLVTAFTFLR